LERGGLWSGLGLVALTIVGEHRRIDTVGFGALALGLGSGAHSGRVEDRDGDLSLVQSAHQAPFIAAGGFADDVNGREHFELLAQLCVTGGSVGKLGLTTFAVDLESRLGDIDSDIDISGICFHSIACVLTHPYEYELLAEADALATVGVLSTGRVPLKLGYGLVENRPRAEGARTRHRCPLRRGSGLIFLPRQEKQKGGKNARGICQREESHPLSHSDTVNPLRPFAPARYARLREGTQGVAEPKSQPCGTAML
jgi:hypothetical protein